MQIVVIGAGEVGFDVARMLSVEEHDVTVVDRDEDALRRVEEKLDVLIVHGSGTSARTLKQSGVEDAEMIVAVTSVDEVNIIACMMASRIGVGTTIARVRSQELSTEQAVLETSDLGIDVMIHPEESAAAEVTRLIRRASATDVLNFAQERLQLLGMRLDGHTGVIGRSLQEVVHMLPDVPFRIMAVARGARTLLPRGEERLQENDQIFVLARPNHLQYITQALGKDEVRMEHIMVLGGTKVGAHVAWQLSQEHGKHVKLIEPNRATAEELAEQLENVLVIHGEATDIDLLAVEGIGEMDAFVAVTNDEESNLVTCLLAKHLGVRKTVALLSKNAYIPISQKIGLDAAVSEKLAVSREVLRFVRGKHVRSVATIHGLDAEVLEVEAARHAPVTRAPLRELSLPKGILIGAIERENSAEVATGESQIAPGDRVIVFVLPQMVKKVSSFFEQA